MSALDQAFIRAYTKDTTIERVRVVATASAPPVAPLAAPAPLTIAALGSITIPAPVKQTPAQTPARAASSTHSKFNPLPADGWYRPEPAPPAAQSVVPAPHIHLANAASAFSTPIFASSMNELAPSGVPVAPAVETVPDTRIDIKSEHSIPAPHFRPTNKVSGKALAAGPHQEPAASALPLTKESDLPPSPVDENRSAQHLSSGREALLQASKTAKPKFSAVWEVDRFLWPENCLNSLSTAFDYFREAGAELRRATRGGLQVLAISSAVRGEGRTTVAMCLAKTVAATGARVALVDADLENPQLGASLGTDSTCGWDDVVRGELPLSEAGIFSLEDRITLLPLSEEISRRNFLLSDARVTNTLKKIADHFELVIVDMGPIGAADRRLFAGGATCPIDAAFVVRDLRLTSHEEAFTTAARLKSNGIRSVGIVENFV